MTTTNTPLHPGFTQVGVIEGLPLGDTPPAESPRESRALAREG